MTAITLQIADHYYGENDWQRSLPYYEAVLEKEAAQRGGAAETGGHL